LYEAILFDFDGVLADTEPVHHASWNEVLEPFSIQFSWADYVKQCVGISDHALVQRFAVPDPGGLVAAKQAALRARMERNPPFTEATLALIPQLARQYRLAVVSSSYRQEIGGPLERAGLVPYFETLVFGDDVRNLKPSPEPYLLALQRLGNPKAVVVEDSATGIAAGKAAGLPVIRIESPELMPQTVRQFLKMV
jgi:beta-phosphoglucomutase